MNNVKILHTADIHIGARDAFLGVAAESRRFETLLTFERIVDLAKEKQADILAIAGDLFENNTVEDTFVEGVFNKINTKINSLDNLNLIYLTCLSYIKQS